MLGQADFPDRRRRDGWSELSSVDRRSRMIVGATISDGAGTWPPHRALLDCYVEQIVCYVVVVVVDA